MDIDGPSRSPDQLAAGKRKRSHDELVHTPTPMDNIDLVNSDGASREYSSADGHTVKRLRRQNSLSPSQSNFSKASSLHVTDLPPETLQHIFSYVHPITLGRLLSVCKLFSALLNPSEALPAPSPGRKNSSLRKQNDIWTRSRKLHLPGYPRPMESMTELDMWRLLRVRSCQFCHRKARRSPSFLNASPWNGGPGPDDVRTIWPFRIRSCGDCLRPRLRLDKDLLLSASSFLGDGLPFAFFTPSHHYVTAVNLDQNQPPLNLQLKKYFYQPDIDELEDKVIEVRALGNAVVEEWSKGLETSGRARREDASRFERWELNVSAQLHLDSGPSTFVEPARPLGPLLSSNPSVFSDASAPRQSRDVDMTSPGRPLSAQSSRYSGLTTATSLPAGPEMPLQPYAPAPGQVSPYPAGPSYPKTESVASETTARSRSKPRPNPQEVERLRSEKRVDIERRCQQIDPPIRPSILPFMDAYNVAMQITMPLNDFSWDFLKRQLIAQRDEAEQKEREHLAAAEASQLAEEDRRLFEEQRRLDKATNDRIWAELGTPPRQKLKAYADDYIATIWDGGVAVTSALGSKFAADVLLHVVRRFNEGIVEEDNLLASRNMRLPAGSGIPDMRRLKLEDIKWVYEESVRPHTERFGKEVFLCSVCENTAKRFNFDAVIQHYAAKHTNDLSKGNQVVYWKAEWPNPPPFHTFPEAVWNRPPDPRATMQATYARSPPHLPGVGAHGESPEHSPGRPSTWVSDEPIRLPTLYDQHCDEVANAAHSALEITDHIKGMPDSVRLCVIIHCVVRSFCSKFPNEPTLALFADCVNNKSSLRQIRDLHGLRCKACRVDIHDVRQEQQGEFWLADLLDHFQKSHVQHNVALEAAYGGSTGPVTGAPRHRLDWQLDMVELPHEQIIRNLAQAPGIDANKLRVLRNVFPQAFSYAVHPFERADDPVMGQYYVPHIGGSKDEYSLHVSAQQSGRVHATSVLIDPAYDRRVGARIPASLSEWRRQPRECEVVYRPPREVVYFDDIGESIRRPARPETAGYAERVPVSWQSMPMREQAGSSHYRPQQRERPYREHEGPRKLPFRLHQVDTHIIDSDTHDNLPPSPKASAIPTAISAVVEEDVRQGDDAMTDAENFLNNFDPLAEQEEAAGTASMSRTASVRQRGLNDDEVGSTVSSRLSQSGTPGRLRREGVRGRGSQTASRIDTPNGSHASRYVARDASPGSGTVKSEAPSLGYRRTDKAPSFRPRTPPASQSPYHDFNNGPPENTFPAYRHDLSPASARYEILDSRHGDDGPFGTASVHDGYARRRFSPVGVHYGESQPSVRYVEVITHDGRHTVEGPLSPGTARYEYERLPPRGFQYVDEGTRPNGFREPLAAPEAYRQPSARPAQGEPRMYYATPSSESANRPDHRRLSTTGSGAYATRQPWSAEPAERR